MLAIEDREISLVKVTRKGQVTIPQGTRERLGIEIGDYLVAMEAKDLIILRKLSLPSWDELFDYGVKFALERDITRDDVLNAIRAVRRGD